MIYVGIIQDTILRALLEIYKNDNIDKNSLDTLLVSYNKVAKNIMTSKEAKNLISQKINKTFLFDKYHINY